MTSNQANEPKTDFNSEHISENVLFFRRKLRMSQKDFVSAYLSDKNGKASLSSGAYSAFENGVSKKSEEIARLIAEKLNIDEKIFWLHPDAFALNIDSLIMNKAQMFEDIMKKPVQLQKTQSYTDALVRIISDQLTDGIMEGEIKPGDKLPSDREMAERFGVGRSTIREALRVISLIGLIEIRPGQGTFVASSPSDFFVTPLSWTLLLGKKSMNDVMVMRNILELGSARLAAGCTDKAALRSFTQLMERMKAAHESYDFKLFLDLDLEFHLTVARCSGNPIILELLRTSRKLMALLSKSGMETMAHIDSIYGEHIRIYNAIMAHDADEAEKGMAEHLENSKGRYTYIPHQILGDN
ncbi:MAG: FCD domain-containing protein [Clostridia bacterium]|nr:FCD domain-containing protein [Clostridia bacterium]